jgi:hypothetical protein
MVPEKQDWSFNLYVQEAEWQGLTQKD